MGKKYNIFLFYTLTYIPEGLFTLYHELSHYIFVFLLWTIGLSTFPVLTIENYCRIVVTDDSTSQFSWSMSVNYVTAENSPLINFLNAICSLMPLFATIFLFYISPIYLCFFYVPYLRILLPSKSDIEDIIYKR